MIQAGAASVVINNELGTFIQGASVDNRADAVRDDLEANGLFLHSGDEAVLLVSCDVVALPTSSVVRAREAIARETGVPARCVILAATHTHAGPSMIPTNYFKPVDTAYLDRLHDRLVDLARRAVAAARPVRIGWGLGAARIGYNRRCCWADGTHSMHGDTSRPDFTGLEGPDDPRHVALFAQDADGRVVAVLHNNTTHPTCFYGADFYSADFPGEARRHLRQVLGPVPVLYLNGAIGDISPDDHLAHGGASETGDQKVARLGHLVAGETLRLLHQAAFHDDPVFAHTHRDLELAVRLPDPDRVGWARDVLARVDAGQDVEPWDRMLAYGVRLLQDEFGDRPVETVPVHALRIGDVGLATQPCELYCQFGIDIKRRSPAPVTAVCGIADGYCGYAPTLAGVIGGGYSGEPLHWTRLANDAGYRITDAAACLLWDLWRS